MSLTVVVILAVAAFVCTVASAAWGRVPLWVAVLLLSLIELLRAFPLGK
jgi:hypothetical protein